MGARAGLQPPQARALGVEQTGRAQRRLSVFEQREQFDGAREGLEQRARDRAGGLFVAPRRVRQSVREAADGGEGLGEFGARSLAVRDEARDVAAVEAAAGDEQVFAGAPGEPAQLHLALGRGGRRARVGAGEREPRVALDALARGEERVARSLVA